MSGRQDSNLRHPGPKPGALPDCATPRKSRAKILSFFRIAKNKMKIFLFNDNYHDLGDFFMIPDTALNVSGRPVFLPDFALPAQGRAHLVLKINRLGKGIASRFASRYFSEITVGLHFTAANLLEELKARCAPWDLAVGFDGAASIGTFVPYEAVAHQVEVTVGKTTLCSYTTDTMLMNPQDIISKLSQSYRLCQGDLIFLGAPTSFSCNLDTRLTLSLDKEPLTSFAVK